MNLLLIGNGFDLAHELPTKYTDFLIFCKIILKFIENNEILIPLNNENKNAEKWINDSNSVTFIDLGKLNRIFVNECPTELSKRDKDVYFNIFNNYLIPMFYGKDIDYKLIKELFYLINKNFWVIYFLDNPIYQKENWIDFESEISQVIQSLDNDMQTLGGERFNLDDIIYELSNNSLKEKYSAYIEAVHPINSVIANKYLAKGITYREVRDELLIDLNKLIRAFEIYLTEYIEKIDIMVISPDIRNIVSFKKEYTIRNTKTIETVYNKVISFNYTNIYEQIYLKNYESDLSKIIDYIHGKANVNNSADSNNIVLGIDEYLSEDRKNKDLEFIAFKKYYQRIHKGTGYKYKEWLDEFIQENSKYIRGIQQCESFIEEYDEDGDDRLKTEATLERLKTKRPKHNLYIFGHSLDVTDKDILRELILTQGMFTTIFYRDLDQKGQQIANLVKVIGQDELIMRTGGGSKRTIEFVKQQDMEKIK